ncbi:MAG: helix-turn-helix domain-containing protein [Planctomycetota bacterium]
MPKLAPPPADDSRPRFPSAPRKGDLPSPDDVTRYVIAVLDRVDPSAKGAHAPSAATDQLMVRLCAKRLKTGPRPTSADWWGYLNDRLRRAPISSVQAVRAWGEQTLLAMLTASSQHDEGAARVGDFKAILAAVDATKLNDEQQRTLNRLRRASSSGYVRHVTAWEGFEQLIVPLPKPKDIFSPSRMYTTAEAARILGVDTRTFKSRIENGELRTEMKKGKVVISGTELDRAYPGGRLQHAPRGITQRGS